MMAHRHILPVNMFIILYVCLSLSSSVTGTNAFSQHGLPLKIQEHRRSVSNNNNIINGINHPLLQGKYSTTSTTTNNNKQHKKQLSNVRQQRPPSLTALRGGFFLPVSNLVSNPFWNAIGIYGICDFVIGFVVSIFTGSHLHLDLVGTGAFAIAALSNIGSSVPHIRWSSIAVSLWGTKLALFLFYRALQINTDNRLTDLLNSTQGSFQFWFITLVWNVLASLPYLLGLLNTSSRSDNKYTLVIGGAIYLAGITIETLADAQKWFFKQDPSKVGQFCNIGLWQHSQHPNWLGNLILWTGILVMNLPALIEPLPDNNGTASLFVRSWSVLWSVRKLVLACLGPSFLWLLFDGQAKGNITNAVELASAKYGKNPDYLKYIQDVPLIIPKNVLKLFR